MNETALPLGTLTNVVATQLLLVGTITANAYVVMSEGCQALRWNSGLYLERSCGSRKALVSCSMRDPDVSRRALQDLGRDSGWLSM